MQRGNFGRYNIMMLGKRAANLCYVWLTACRIIIMKF